MKILQTELTGARNGNLDSILGLLDWWAWNDPNGTWADCIDVTDGSHVDGPTEGVDYSCAGPELVEYTLEYLGDESDEWII